MVFRCFLFRLYLHFCPHILFDNIILAILSGTQVCMLCFVNTDMIRDLAICILFLGKQTILLATSSHGGLSLSRLYTHTCFYLYSLCSIFPHALTSISGYPFAEMLCVRSCYASVPSLHFFMIMVSALSYGLLLVI